MGASSGVEEVKKANLALMVAESGYDVTIICTSDDAQAMYWEDRLNNAKGTVIPSGGLAVAVDEDWDGGAGNFLGTLYAWKKACAKLLAAPTPIDLRQMLEDGASVALFHTAGKGTRMAPLPGGENNNKPGVKLPAPGGPSILECVIRQTGAYATARKGRLSVFWGDQIFVPSVPAEYVPKHHVDIACMLGPMPSAQEWADRGLEKYGCIAADGDLNVEAMLEKVTHEIADERVRACNAVEKIGASLGSFSLSSPFLAALSAGFDTELEARSGKMDSDPHVWMPMTLSCDAYADVMVKKGEFTAAEAKEHWTRISTLVSEFKAEDSSDFRMFGAVDVGLECSWWDYGLLKLYVKNMLLLTEGDGEATLARAFFGIPESGRIANDCQVGATVDDTSVVSKSKVVAGTITGSAVYGVAAEEASLDGAIAVNCCAKKLTLGKGAVCYNVYDDSEEGVVLGENEVRVGVWMPGKEVPYFVMKSNWAEIDGGKKFKEPVKDNGKSFQDVYNMNLGVNVIKCSEVAACKRRIFAAALPPQPDINAVKCSNMELMSAKSGYDVTIVCTSDEAQAMYWEQRLNSARGTVIPAGGIAVAVDEDWDGGAGNFLGTLYAWKKACAKLLAADKPRDLQKELEAGASVALFHTAGKGTRMAPLPGGENNNKPGVKLPAPGGPSILECVIRQTGSYASARQGRLSVFWGDQIFVPSVPAEYVPQHHVDIACMLGPMPSAQEWAERGLEKYGCIAAKADNSVEAMLEKVSHEIADERVKACDGVEKIGASLGSFSLSSPFLAALVGGFQAELQAKAGKMDSDPHVWMPMTLSCEAYADVMVKKGEFTADEATKHWQRVSALVDGFKANTASTLGMFGAVDVGLECSWWDYGLLKLYVKNMLLLTEDGTEATLARAFFGIPESSSRVSGNCQIGSSVCVDSQSVVNNSKIVSGSIVGSAVFGVSAKEAAIAGAIAVNCCAKKLTLGKGAVCYNVFDDSEEGIVLGENQVRVGVWMPGKEVPYFEMNSNWADIDGGKKFKEAVMNNGKSFQDVYNMNLGVNVIKCSEVAARKRAIFATNLPPHPSLEDVKMHNMEVMTAECGYDVTIVCTSDDAQAMYWEDRLNSAKGTVIPSNGIAVAVDEDWDGGAGNFLGTLYAWKKACAKLLAADKPRDLEKELQAGASVAIFHTAGKGTRMAPLPGGENNNKPGVKLPAPGGPSILECVIRQTGAYAQARQGRLSVFWGDQIFVPSVPAEYVPMHHVDIACMLGPMPSATEWEERGLEKYGCIAATKDNSVEAMLEKVSHEIADERVQACTGVEKIGASLGSFSLSSPFLAALMAGFKSELEARAGKMDSDPHVWMPMTLSCDAYADVMVKKGEFTAEEAKQHWQRVSELVSAFKSKTTSSMGMFGAVDVGLECSWWDYGLLKLYVKNMLLLTENNTEAMLARAFFGIPESGRRVSRDSQLGSKVSVDKASVVTCSKVVSGSIKGSAVYGVAANEVSLDGAIAVNCCAKKLKLAPGAVCYNVYDESDAGIVLGENEVRVGVWMPGKDVPYFEMKSNWAEIDGGKKFKEPVKGNSRSFQDVYNLNLGVNVIKCSQTSAFRRRLFAQGLPPLSSIKELKFKNMALMTAKSGYDVTIVCTSDEAQALYWEDRLNDAKGTVIPSSGIAVAVDEDWDGGAGNFLGTLYAWKKACAKLLAADRPRDLQKELQAGASVAIFHTAGKGTRMAPLPGGENNNKPGVKLPAPGGPSILECVIRQTGSYATARSGRLSVFWGDQIFVPSVPAEYVPMHHVDIACMLGPMPSAKEWEERGLEKYGCIAATKDNSVEAMLEKVSHQIADERVKACTCVEKIGASLGSFSLSSPFLAALMAGFKSDLDAKCGKMDSDPHVWMPMTLSCDAYADVMVKKGEFTAEEAKLHWRRVATIVDVFKVSTSSTLGMFGAVDVGLECSWWDYGLLKLYVQNMLLLTEDTAEATLARAFFGIPESRLRVSSDSSMGSQVCVDMKSVVGSSKIVSGSVAGSAVFGVGAQELCADGAICVNSCAKKISLAKGAVCYNVYDMSDGGIVLAENEVRVGVWMPGQTPPYFEMKSNWKEIDGGKKFKEPVKDNGKSFQDVYNMNLGVNVIKCSAEAAAKRAAFMDSLKC